MASWQEKGQGESGVRAMHCHTRPTPLFLPMSLRCCVVCHREQTSAIAVGITSCQLRAYCCPALPALQFLHKWISRIVPMKLVTLVKMYRVTQKNGNFCQTNTNRIHATTKNFIDSYWTTATCQLRNNNPNYQIFCIVASCCTRLTFNIK
jgi:hypothetical protein